MRMPDMAFILSYLEGRLAESVGSASSDGEITRNERHASWIPARRVLIAVILFDSIAFFMAYYLQGTTPSEARAFGAAAVMGTAYSVAIRNRATLLGLLIWTVGGAIIGGTYPYTL